MKTVTFTQFRNNASSLFSDVEKGEILIVLRHGRPIAEVTPVSSDGDRAPLWKRPGLKLSTDGAGLCAAILEERRSEDVL